MEKTAAEILADNGNGRVREKYTPRALSVTTTGVRFNTERDFFFSVACVMKYGTYESRDAVAAALKTIRSDSMGTGIIYY